MPNHVRNTVRITGDADTIRKLMAEVKGVEKMRFDFDRIIPMPPSLMIESSSRAEDGKAILAYRERGDDNLLKLMLDRPWAKQAGITTVEAMAMNLEKKDAEGMENWRKRPDDPFREPNRLSSVELARAVEKNIKDHGYPNWYDWSYDHWGTKWNAYDQTEPVLAPDGKSVTYQFNTAWDTPTPVLQALVDKYDVEITVDVSGEVDRPYTYGFPKQRCHV